MIYLLSVQQSTISSSITYFFAFLLLAMILCLALEEKIHAKKSLITGFFAFLCLLFSSIFLPLPHGQSHMPFYIPFIDWEVVLIIIGASLFVDVVSRSGIFSWIALKLTKLSQGKIFTLLLYYSLLTVLFSAFLNNVTAMMIIGSLTALSLRKLEKSEKLLGFLLVEGLLTNVGGLLTLISSVPNIILGQKAGITFGEFFIKACPYVLISSLVTIYLARWLFNLATEEGGEEERKNLLEAFDEQEGIQSWNFFYFSWAMLVLLIFFFSTQSFLPILKDLGLGFVAMAMAILVMFRYKHEVDQNYKALDWDLIFFFVFLFVVIGIMEMAGVLTLLGRLLSALIGLGKWGGPISLLMGSAAASSVTDNIPLAAVLANILGNMHVPGDSNLWWSVIFGANLGGNVTPIGSASTVVALTIIRKEEISLTFMGFVKKALPFALVQILLAALYVVLFL
ncbi:MAG: hypothetical protein D6785_01005 [Planctomycetota bacterium]|nr:MAG: hypothetical protein D6785_01005 [Planctomycetota bacterium]